MGLLGDIAGGIVSGGIGLIGQHNANKTNISQANTNRDFQERMSRNAHQYEVEDLKAAGLNPILSAGGGGAATPSGSTANVQSETGAAADAAQEIWAKKNERDRIKMAEHAEEEAIWTQAAQRSKTNADKEKTKIDTKNAEVTNEILRSEAQAAKAEAFARIKEAQTSAARSEIDKQMVKPDALGSRLKSIIQSGATGAAAIKGRGPSITIDETFGGNGELKSYKTRRRGK